MFSKMGKGGRGIQPSRLFSEGFGTDEDNLRDPAWITMFDGLSPENVTKDLSSDEEW